MLVIIYVMQIYWFVLVRSGQTRHHCVRSLTHVCTDCSGRSARHPGSLQHRGRARGGQLEQGQEAEVKSELSQKTPASVLFFVVSSKCARLPHPTARLFRVTGFFFFLCYTHKPLGVGRSGANLRSGASLAVCQAQEVERGVLKQLRERSHALELRGLGRQRLVARPHRNARDLRAPGESAQTQRESV